MGVSEVGMGTSFKIYLPQAQGAEKFLRLKKANPL